ncbi:ATP-binding protein [Terrimonas sp. NA20]|uniref:histidine kinase n=1 Tax=Terrimonas ginsenosidimutans TaxID=2908004 RepID=A0ABS9KLV1_9BACT|nr:ATP-binding protein [Terrimonas ginsenosidimutans]MCG2613289.1 ATP-binding protein [Terrimonas ginsenosidimutans]
MKLVKSNPYSYPYLLLPKTFILLNPHLQNIKKLLEPADLPEAEKAALLKAITDADKQWAITDFKLDRTGKVKKTTAILLEETIEELEQKRKAVEDTNAALERSLTELKSAQQQLVQSEKMASLGELTAGIAHEIQNPLNFVNNFSEISAELIDEMKEELKNGNHEEALQIAEDIKQNLEKINHHGKRADGIVKGMLQHSRTGSGQKELTDINALCEEYVRLCYHGLRAKENTFNATIITDFDPSLTGVNIIPQDMGRVIMNILTNAFYAVNEKKKRQIPGYDATVSIKTEHCGNKATIAVSDNGYGIPQQIIDKIFQPFFTTKPTGQGTGLGLSLSYDIVAKGHGGELKAETKEGEGSLFTITLPNTK